MNKLAEDISSRAMVKLALMESVLGSPNDSDDYSNKELIARILGGVAGLYAGNRLVAPVTGTLGAFAGGIPAALVAEGLGRGLGTSLDMLQVGATTGALGGGLAGLIGSGMLGARGAGMLME